MAIVVRRMRTRVEVERRKRNRLLTAFLDTLDAEYGAVDEALVAKYMELL